VQERLQKFLARAGVASRRHAEGLITAGRVSVNNERVTELGTKIDPDTDLVTVDGKHVAASEERRYFLFYKPVGVVTTLDDPEGRPSIKAFVQELEGRVFPVGRLDYDAEGALLLTDDGELANRLMHPRYQVERTYLVKVKGQPTPETLEKLRGGVRLEDGFAKPAAVEVFEEAERNLWIKLVVTEGRPHLVKRLCAAIGHPVLRLFRPSHGGIGVQGLKPGALRRLTADEIDRLMRASEGEKLPEAELKLPARRHGRAGELAESLGLTDDSPVQPERRTGGPESKAQRFARGSSRPEGRGGDRGAKPRKFGAGRPGEARSGGGEKRAFGGPRGEGGEGRRSFGVGEKRAFGGPRGEGGAGGGAKRSFGGPRGEGGEGRRSFGGEKRGFGGPRGEGGEKRSFGGPRGEGGEGRRSFGGEKRSFGGPRGEGGEARRSFGGEKRGFGGPRGEGGEKRSFGGPRAEGGEKRGFGGPRGESGEKRSFGGPRAEGGEGRRSFGGGKRSFGGPGREVGEGRGEKRGFGGPRGEGGEGRRSFGGPRGQVGEFRGGRRPFGGDRIGPRKGSGGKFGKLPSKRGPRNPRGS
jgi:23S rRNA pseudouridine2605 synthase